MTRSCIAALHAEAYVGHLLRKEMRTSIQRIGTVATPLKIGEETIAESMLLDLADRFGDVVEVVMFTRRAEARRFGADWLWCFETPTGNHFMLVQAKRPEEPMSMRNRSWTVRIPTDTNLTTGKTQHETLIEAATNLGVAPCYCLFAPAQHTCGCYHASDFEDWDWFDVWPRPRNAGPGYVHIVKAGFWSPGSKSVDSSNPPGITLSALLCCEYGGFGLVGRDFDPGYWDMTNPDLSWDRLLHLLVSPAIADRQKVQPEFSSIVGAIRIRVSSSD